ncbi:MAG TPA: MG2 domain-containing protein [Planctomycetota bacterium]|nr:MG2 domain-containing protein [Planctomycetota bacterium]HQB01370.1 MG2 domain-containing protein [Planctomycetota bacterium]
MNATRKNMFRAYRQFCKKGKVGVEEFLKQHPEYKELGQDVDGLFVFCTERRSPVWNALLLFLVLFLLGSNVVLGWKYFFSVHGVNVQYELRQEDGKAFPIFVSFDKKMILDDYVGKEVSNLVSIEPAIPLYVEWKSTDCLCVRSMDSVPKATRFTLNLSKNLRSLDGSTLNTAPLLFSTDPLELVAFEQVELRKNGDVFFHLSFDDFVSRNNLLKKLNVSENESFPTFHLYDIPHRGKVYGHEAIRHVDWDSVESKDWELFIAGSQYQAGISLAIADGLQGRGGELGLECGFSQFFSLPRTENVFSLSYHSAFSPSMGDCSVRFTWNDAVDYYSAVEHVKIFPNVPCMIRAEGNSLSFKGGFQPNTQYSFSFTSGMKSKNGWKTVGNIDRIVTFPERETSFTIVGKGDILSLHGQNSIVVQSMNLPCVEALVYRIYSENMPLVLQRSLNWYSCQKYGSLIAKKNVSLNMNFEEAKTNIDLKNLLGDLFCSGVYYVVFRGNDEYDVFDSKLLICSDIGLTSVCAKEECIVWTTSLQSGEALSNVNFSVFTNKNQCIGRGVTNDVGVGKVMIPTLPEDEYVSVVHGLKEADFNVLKVTDNEWDVVVFDTKGKKSCSKEYQAFIASDRGAYRPGEVLHLQSIVRNRACHVAESFPIEFVILRSDNTEIQRQQVKLDVIGNSCFDWSIPNDVRTGFYRAEVRIPGAKDALGQYEFQIEDFVPDTYRFSVNCESKELFAGDNVSVHLAAEHLHGAPAAGNSVQVTAMLSPRSIVHRKYPEYCFGNSQISSAMRKIAEQTIVLSEEGQGIWDFTIPDELVLPSWGEICVQATLLETGGRTTTRTTTVNVYPKNLDVGISLANNEKLTANVPILVNMIALTPKEEVVQECSYDVQVVRYEWNWHREKQENGEGYRYIKSEYFVHECSVMGDHFSFIPEQYGEYGILVTEKNTKSSAYVSLDVFGGSVVTKKGGQEYVEVSFDKKEYTKGESAKLLVKSPFDGKAFVCFARESVFDSFVVDVKDGKGELDFVVPEEYSPNVYCMVSVVRSVAVADGLQRVYGIAPLFVAPESTLMLSMECVESVRPLSSINIEFTVLQDEKAVKDAYITFVAVDEGVCQLTNFSLPNPYEFFYGKRALEVKMSDVFDNILPETMPGDGKALKRSAPLAIKKDSTVVIWRSDIKTDEHGKAEITLDVPDYIGELRLMAWCHQGKNFGAQQSKLSVVSPAPFIPCLPRFVTWNDEWMLQASVQNLTGDVANLNLSVHMDGLTTEQNSAVSVSLQNNEEYVYSLPVRVISGIQKANIVFTGTLGKEKIGKVYSLRVRGPVSLQHVSDCGMLAVGVEQNILPSIEYENNTGEYTLTLSDNPNVHLAKYMESLLKYPYGCLEQTTSRAFPLLYYHDIFLLSKSEDTMRQKVANSYIMDAIQRISLMQTYYGGLSMWPGGDSVFAWGTVYASHFLVEAVKLGYPVPESLYKGCLLWIRKALRGMNSEVAAYGAYVLANAELLAYQDIAFLCEKEQYSDVEADFLTCTLLLLHKPEQARVIFDKRNTLPSINFGAMSENLHSTCRNQAIYLLTLLEIEPENPEILKMVKLLNKGNREDYSTQENAFILLALGKYSKELQKVTSKFQGNFSYGTDLVAEFSHEKPYTIQGKLIGDEPFIVKTKGSGNLFYFLQSSGIPKNVTIDAKSNGIYVQRRLLNKDMQLMSKNVIRKGELIWVEVEVVANDPYRNLILEQFLPSGVEVENPRLVTTVKKTKTDDLNILWPEYVDMRDDRISAFFHAKVKNVAQKWYFGMRGTTTGSFYFPPLTVQCMYDASIQANTVSEHLYVE